ncbi:MAG TPA: histidine kinase N-terminal 7TM domain-containing protein, partial [Verrucomicrobiae bacterium]
MLAFAVAAFSWVVACAVIWHERRSAPQLAFLAGMAFLAAETIFAGLAWRAPVLAEALIWQRWHLATDSLLPAVWLVFAVTYGRGNYRDFLNRWKLLLLAAFIVPLGLLLTGADQLILVDKASNSSWQFSLGEVGFYLCLLQIAGLILVGINLEKTYRAAVGVMRWRIKFMVVGLGVLLAVRFCTSGQLLLNHTVDVQMQMVDAGALAVSCLLMGRSLFRLGHFELDVYPSHAVLQRSVTILLAGLYLVVIGVLARLLAFLGRNEVVLPKAFLILMGLVILTILLLSDRVRLRINRFVSRNFQRPLYDYRLVWRQFTETTAACANESELCQHAVRSVSDIFHALSVTIWLVDEKQGQLAYAASTFLTEAKAGNLRPDKDEFAEVLQTVRSQCDPVDIDLVWGKWAEVLRRCHPEEFRKGGRRMCVPMRAGEELIGLLLLGDRVSAATFTWQDNDLLKCIGDHVAAGLLNLRLAQKLLQAKELEAFQTMSAFFVHDLKNTANTLNLMLQNLPEHFDDPAFRADALRGVAKTVAHINGLVSRLGSIRQELQLRPVEGDLNEVIAKALTGWEDVAGIDLKKDLAPLPKLFFDQDQMLKVTTNLIFNAREAVANSRGRVQIQTSQKNGWAVLSVS